MLKNHFYQRRGRVLCCRGDRPDASTRAVRHHVLPPRLRGPLALLREMRSRRRFPGDKARRRGVRFARRAAEGLPKSKTSGVLHARARIVLGGGAAHGHHQVRPEANLLAQVVPAPRRAGGDRLELQSGAAVRSRGGATAFRRRELREQPGKSTRGEGARSEGLLVPTRNPRSCCVRRRQTLRQHRLRQHRRVRAEVDGVSIVARD